MRNQLIERTLTAHLPMGIQVFGDTPAEVEYTVTMDESQMPSRVNNLNVQRVWLSGCELNIREHLTINQLEKILNHLFDKHEPIDPTNPFT